MSREKFAHLVLHEGAEMGAFPQDEALALRLSPYDSFALFLHGQKMRLGAS